MPNFTPVAGNTIVTGQLVTIDPASPGGPILTAYKRDFNRILIFNYTPNVFTVKTSKILKILPAFTADMFALSPADPTVMLTPTSTLSPTVSSNQILGTYFEPQDQDLGQNYPFSLGSSSGSAAGVPPGAESLSFVQTTAAYGGANSNPVLVLSAASRPVNVQPQHYYITNIIISAKAGPNTAITLVSFFDSAGVLNFDMIGLPVNGSFEDNFTFAIPLQMPGAVIPRGTLSIAWPAGGATDTLNCSMNLLGFLL